jgi:hypothetical protein
MAKILSIHPVTRSQPVAKAARLSGNFESVAVCALMLSGALTGLLGACVMLSLARLF